MALQKLATEPKTFLGTRPLLFDRLVDDDLNTSFETSEFLSEQEVKNSITLEISRLLNTRASEKLDTMISNPTYGVPPTYGFKDFESFDATNTQDWPLIKKLITDSIDYFEPRLKKIDVEIVNFDDKTQKLIIQISGKLHLQKLEGEVTFPVAISIGA